MTKTYINDMYVNSLLDELRIYIKKLKINKLNNIVYQYKLHNIP